MNRKIKNKLFGTLEVLLISIQKTIELNKIISDHDDDIGDIGNVGGSNVLKDTSSKLY